MPFSNIILGMTHGQREGGANPELSGEGFRQMFDMDLELLNILPRMNLTLVAIGMAERFVQTYKMIQGVLELLSKPEIKYSWLLAAGGSVDDNTQEFISDSGMHFPAHSCIPISPKAAWDHLQYIDDIMPGDKIVIGARQFFSNLGFQTNSASVYNIIWQPQGLQREVVLVHKGRLVTEHLESLKKT